MGLQYSALALVGGASGPSQATKIADLDWAWPISSLAVLMIVV